MRIEETTSALFLALALLTVSSTGCLLSSDQGTTSSNWSDEGDPDLSQTLGDPGTSGLEDWPGVFDSDPTTYDFDGDGVREVVAHSDDTNVYVYDARSGRALATLSTHYPPAWHIERILNSPSAGVLEPGEPASIVVANHAAFVSVWQYDPEASDGGGFVFDKRWETRMDGCHGSPGMDAGPVLADLTGDGALEILVQTEEEGLFAVNKDGTVLWKKCWGGGNGEPVAADLDSDGSLEAVFASDAGVISAFEGASGTTLWTFDSRQYVEPASVPVAPTVADLDGEDPLEILFTARNATHTDEDEYDLNKMAIFAIQGNRTNGTSELVWVRQPDWANPMSYTHLVVEDVDGDGTQDIFGMDWNTIGHRPGQWENLGPAHVFRLNASGGDVWVREMDAWWSNKDIALGDFDGDGTYEVLVNAPVDDGDGMWRLSADNGQAEGFLAISPWKIQRVSMPEDLDGDGSMELMFPVRPMDESLERGAILVYDLDVELDVALPAPPPDAREPS